MKRSLEKTGVSLVSERCFCFRAVNHDSAPIFCQDGVLQEIFPGIYITVDPQSGIGLLEVNPAERSAKLQLNGQDILDIAQIARRDVLSIDGKNYVFLKYMDAYFNKTRVRSHASTAIETNLKVFPFVTAEKQVEVAAAVRPDVSVFSRLPKRTKILGVITAAVTLTSVLAVALSGPTSSSSLEQTASETVEATPVKPAKQAPTTLNDLISEDEKAIPSKVEETAGRESVKKEAEAIPENNSVKTENTPPAKPASATWIKPTSPKKVKKPIATPAPAAPVSEAAMKSFENDFQEAVLIKGYDQERSVRILKQLRKKVPAGTALRQKIEKELR